MKAVTLRAHAKINLLLCVGGIRSDGKHDVVTVMNTVSGLYDIVTVSLNDSEKISVSCDTPGVPCGESNLAFKAAALYRDTLGSRTGISINIEKHIPVTAGMGGGSSDAAAVLSALHELCGTGNIDDLCRIAAKLGSDVPFFLYRKRTMLCTGTGEHAASCPELSGRVYGVFVTEGTKESTAKAYSDLDKKIPQEVRLMHIDSLKDKFLSALGSGQFAEITGAMKNDFEAVSGHFPEVSSELLSNGADQAILCGSGPTVCGIFSDIEKARICYENLHYRCFFCEI